MKTLALPDGVARALERYKKERGRSWSKELVELLQADLRREKALSELREMAQGIRAKSSLSEKEVYKRLE